MVEDETEHKYFPATAHRDKHTTDKHTNIDIDEDRPDTHSPCTFNETLNLYKQSIGISPLKKLWTFLSLKKLGDLSPCTFTETFSLHKQSIGISPL